MKRLIISIAIALSGACAGTATVHAAGIVFGSSDICSQAGNSAACSAPSENVVNKTLVNAINLAAVLGGAIGVIFVVVGGVKYVFSAGDSGRAESARNTIIYALVGLLVIAVARAIVGFVLGKIHHS